MSEKKLRHYVCIIAAMLMLTIPVFGSEYASGEISVNSEAAWTENNVVLQVGEKVIDVAADTDPDPNNIPAPVIKSLVGMNRGVSISWGRITGIPYYRIFRREAGKTWQRVADTNRFDYYDTTAVPGKTYIYTVRGMSNDRKKFISPYLPGKSIRFAAVPSITQIKPTAKALQVSWKAASGAVNYAVFRKASNQSSWSRIATTKTLTYSDATVKNGTNYIYTIRPVSSDNKYYTGGYNTTGKNYCYLSAPAISGITSTAAGRITVNWNRNTAVTGYQVYYNDGIVAKVVNSNGSTANTKTISNLTKGTTYSVLVRSYKTINKVNYISAWSSAKTVRVSFGANAGEMSGYTTIMGMPVATAAQMQAYIKKANPSVPKSVIDMIPYYLSEGRIEGVRGDIAFAQSCLETGNFGFVGSAVTLDQNNFCGMGVVVNGVKGNSFATPQLGIRAQIQHLKAYASKEPLKQACVDPRFTYVSRGISEYIEWLAIKDNPNHVGWALGPNYGKLIMGILDEILKM